MPRGRLDRFNELMERLVRRWLPDLSAGDDAESDRGNRRVLIAMGDEPLSNLALDVAQEIGRWKQSEIVLADIVEVPPPATEREGREWEDATARHRLAEAARRLEAEGISVRCIVFPARCLVGAVDNLAKNLNTDLVLYVGDRTRLRPEEKGHDDDETGDTVFGTVTHARS